MTLPNLFPALDAATEAALRESIQRFGVLVPVVRDQHGRTLDGHHRSRLADDLGVKYRVDRITVESDEQAREIAATLNIDRRQLDSEQRHEIVLALREAGHSTTAIAGVVGASQSTVDRDIRELTRAGKLDPPNRVVGLDGKSRPARRPTIVAAKNQQEAERAHAALALIDNDTLPSGGVLDVKRIERIAREAEAEQRRAAPVDRVSVADDIEIRHGDFRDALADLCEECVVITDPPYPREFLTEWEAMAEWALHWGCERLVAMAGQSILPEALTAILRAERLPVAADDGDWNRWHYRWCGAYLTVGPTTRVWAAKVGTSWKPILIFDRGSEREFITTDLFRPTGDDKRYHRWGQNENGIASLVEAFTEPGDLVVDPFLGGGTTAVVCKALGRRFIGCDIDGAAVDVARGRLAA